VAGTVRTNGANLNVRSGTSTSTAIVGSLANGASVSIQCQTRGQSIAGYFGTSNIGNRIGSGRSPMRTPTRAPTAWWRRSADRDRPTSALARAGVTRPGLVLALLASALAGAVLGAAWMHHGGRAQDGPAPSPAGSGITGSAAQAVSPRPVDGPSGFPEPASRLQLMQRYAGALDEDTR